jgi:hypothetical protein
MSVMALVPPRGHWGLAFAHGTCGCASVYAISARGPRCSRPRPRLCLSVCLSVHAAVVSGPRLRLAAQVACELELWQEAFRSVEDIQGLMAMGRKPPKAQMMASYYARLTRIFTVSENHLYAGYAWFKLFSLAKTYNKNLTAADAQVRRCSAVCNWV